MRQSETLYFSMTPECCPLFALFGGLIFAIIGSLISYSTGKSDMSGIELLKHTAYGAIPIVGWMFGIVLFGHGLACIMMLLNSESNSHLG